MWAGPYGEWGSRKYLLASLIRACAGCARITSKHLLLAPLRSRHAARGDDGRAGERRAAGKALYAGVSSYSARKTTGGCGHLARAWGGPLPDPSALVFDAEPLDRGGLLEALGQEGIGCLAFSPLAQGC